MPAMSKRNTPAFKRFMREVLRPVEIEERTANRPQQSNVRWLPAMGPLATELASEELLLRMLAVMLQDVGEGQSPPATIVAHLLSRHARQGR